MSNVQITVDQFRKAAVERFAFLEAQGFRHAVELEETASTFGTVVYLGKNIGFVFSFDVRDQCIDGEVAKVSQGKLQRNWEGGYSSNIFTHLVKHAGYRGKPGGAGKVADSTSLKRMLDAWAELLMQACRLLLEDRADALPVA
jgi:hypothetical protein